MNKLSTLLATVGLTGVYISLQVFVRSSSLLNLAASCVVALAFYFVLEVSRAGKKIPALAALGGAMIFFVVCLTGTGERFDFPDTADVASFQAGLIALLMIVPSWLRGRKSIENIAR
jgi:hypothetical protein